VNGGLSMGDKKIICIDCNKDFVFTEGEQQFFEETVNRLGVKTVGVKERVKKEQVDLDDKLLIPFNL
jgi:hypothetical protein